MYRTLESDNDTTSSSARQIAQEYEAKITYTALSSVVLGELVRFQRIC